MIDYFSAWILAIAMLTGIIVRRFTKRSSVADQADQLISGRQRVRQAVREEAYRQIGGASVSRKMKRLAARAIARKLETKKEG